MLVGISYFKFDRFWPQWFAFYVLGTLSLGSYLYFQVSRAWGVLATYLLLHCVYLGTYRLTAYDSMAAIDRIVLKYHAMEFGFCILLCVLLSQVLNHLRINVNTVLSRLFIGHYIYTLLTYVFFDAFYGFNGNYGMNSGLMVILSCFGPLWWTLASIPFVIHSEASSPLLVLGVVLVCRLWKYRHSKEVIPGLALAAATFVYFNPEYLNDSARFKNWKLYMEYFFRANREVLGMGAEVFKSFGPYLQTVHGEKHEYLLWAHNEYLEILFNYGFVGVTLVVSTVLGGIYFAYRRRNMAVVYGLLGMSAMAITNYPLRLAPTAIVCLLLLHEAYRPWRKA